MNEERFSQACQKIVCHNRERNKIGTLGEKTLHAVLKNASIRRKLIRFLRD